MATGLRLPVDLTTQGGQKPTGFGTPAQDRSPQTAHFAPRRVLPIIFLPGIMGSNLCVTSPERMQALGRKSPENNIAWRPDSISAKNVGKHASNDAAERQLTLDPATTAVDVYNPQSRNQALDGDDRHGNVTLGQNVCSPYLVDDPQSKPGALTAAQKARQRGWGEVFFKSYGSLLQHLEIRLNNMFLDGKAHPAWADVLGVDPIFWKADPRLPQSVLKEEELRKVANGCWFPVHAIGYNWLQSNDLSAGAVATRIEAIINSYANARNNNNQSRFECKQVIVVTHSMGGLVGRALVHPDFGGLHSKVLGIVHGVQPAVGAAAAYKRIRAGFEDPGMTLLDTAQAEASISAKVSGNYGDEVTAVLANSPGGLQLLPSAAYGEGWLQIRHNGINIDSFPKINPDTGRADPYKDIYKARGKWYGLIPNERWINPSGLSEQEGGGSFARTATHLDKAQRFHDAIEATYHPWTYVHFGQDQERLSYGNVTWEINSKLSDISGWNNWPLLIDDRQGQLRIERYDQTKDALMGRRRGVTTAPSVAVKLLPPDEAGDQTVPIRSAEHQFKSGKCKAVFRQDGYEHQGSYQNSNAISSTLYSIVRIAQQARWES